MLIKKVFSGGQTGVDRAGLDAAMEAGIPVGGYCPKGRVTEDGVIPDIYPLTECVSEEVSYVIEQNVVHSDGILILHQGEMTYGTKLTEVLAVMKGKPRMVVHLDPENINKPSQVISWLNKHHISILGIAGPRESKCPGIYQDAHEYLSIFFKTLKEETAP